MLHTLLALFGIIYLDLRHFKAQEITEEVRPVTEIEDLSTVDLFDVVDWSTTNPTPSFVPDFESGDFRKHKEVEEDFPRIINASDAEELKVICYCSKPLDHQRGKLVVISSLCTHIIIVAAILHENKLTMVNNSTDWKETVVAFQRKGLKVLLKIGGWNDSDECDPVFCQGEPRQSKYSILIANETLRERFLKSTITVLDMYGLDGLEIDWRYPKYWKGSGTRGHPEDRENFALWIKELSTSFKEKGWLLSSTGAPQPFLDGYNIEELMKYLDWITLVTYYFHGDWDERAATHSPLSYAANNGGTTTDVTVGRWINGVDAYRSKLLITLPFYGVWVTLKDYTKNGRGAEIVTNGPSGTVYYKELCRQIIRDEWTYVLDPDLKAGPHAHSCYQWISFDDPAMTEAKARFAKKQRLGGVAVNSIEFDDDENNCGCESYPLLKALNRGLGRLPGTVKCTLPTRADTQRLCGWKKNLIILLSVIAVFLVLVVVVAVAVIKFKERRRAAAIKTMKTVLRRPLSENSNTEQDSEDINLRGHMWALGAVESGWRNPEETDPGWEVPRCNIKILHLLGQGFFGQVWMCKVQDLKGINEETIAAAKTLKEVAGDAERRELLQELQMMKQLGSHPNVLSLLGCCTDRDPVLLILEYVPGGKLQTYLRKSRSGFRYSNLHCASSTLTSTDLINFGYQVSRGMEYLSSKGVVHRDLAARNVLIDDKTKTCKVADFGFARDLEDGLAYEKKSDGKLPIRWLSPESLCDNVYTTKSDVWSFGVLLWEIIALGATPYPGLSASEVMKRVMKGYRLEKPNYCGEDFYEIMMCCWHEYPEERPSFSELVERLENLLSAELDYVDLSGIGDDYDYQDICENSEEKV